MGVPAVVRPVGIARPYVGPVPPAARPAAFAFKFLAARTRTRDDLFAPPPRPRTISGPPFRGSSRRLARVLTARSGATAATPRASQVLRRPAGPASLPPRPVLFPLTAGRAVLPALQPTRAKALPAPPPFVRIPPPRLPPLAVIARTIYPATSVRPRQTPQPPPARSAAFTIPFQPLVARGTPALPATRPAIGIEPPRPRVVVTRRPPAALVAVPPRAPTPVPRPVAIQPGRGRPAMVREFLPVLSVRALLAVPVSRPRVLSLLRPVTVRPLFLFGPRFTIRDPGTVATLADPGVQFTVRDPGVSVQLPLE